MTIFLEHADIDRIISWVDFRYWYGKFNIFDSYALASTYGAVGAVTFSVGLSFLDNQGVTSEGYLAAILAVLEPVAFILAIFLTNMAVSKQVNAKKEALAKNMDSPPKLSSGASSPSGR